MSILTTFASRPRRPRLYRARARPTSRRPLHQDGRHGDRTLRPEPRTLNPPSLRCFVACSEEHTLEGPLRAFRDSRRARSRVMTSLRQRTETKAAAFDVRRSDTHP